MSEYQYYEFQTLDGAMSAAAKDAVKGLSSRVHVTARSASFVYNYGDFRGDPYQLMCDYFDAMLYITNWGSRQLMLRFPASAIPDEIMEQYEYAENLEWSTVGDHVIVNMEYHEEEGGDWVEGEGLLDGIVQVRDDILRGDYRALYLAWLKIAEDELYVLEEDEDLTEPPLPPNMGRLTPALDNFVEFFMLNVDLVAAAAQGSATVSQKSENLSPYLDRLSDEEKRDFLQRLLANETNLDVALKKRLRELSGGSKKPLSNEGERRTIRQLVALSKQAEQQRREEERQRAEAARLKKLEAVAKREDQLWLKVHDLLEQKRAKEYEAAVNILKDLHALAVHTGQMPTFAARMREIQETFSKSQSLRDRFKAAGLYQK